MKITNLKVNHLTNPVGYRFEHLHFTWNVTETNAKQGIMGKLRIWKADEMIEEFDLSPWAWFLDAKLCLEPFTRYEWTVEIEADNGERATSEKAFFETGRQDSKWEAQWLIADATATSVYFKKLFQLENTVSSARLYICGLGLYEVYVNREMLGEERLLPGYHSYDLVTEYQTMDVTELLQKSGDEAELVVMLGNGWYKGRFVFDGGFENIYGKNLKLIAELHIQYANGQKEIVCTDDSWNCFTSEIDNNNIYDGEVNDYRLRGNEVLYTLESVAREYMLVERTTMPIKEVEVLSPKRIIVTPQGDTVLDFGEMITGWVRFLCKEKQDVRIRLQYGEWLVHGNFYRENLRTAKAEYIYVSEGVQKWIRPHFTYYGFRYVKVEGISDVRLEDFKAARIRSACDVNGRIITGNEKVNRLIANAYASQQCNFLDIPTDCPQRDERMGWTGDIAVFADTACFQMESAGFLNHYMQMLKKEQKACGGKVPFTVPWPKPNSKENAAVDKNPFMRAVTACGWGDAATLVPWTLYEHYQDINLLREYYPIMKDWIAYEKGRAVNNTIPYLWQQDLQLGDWLALDSQDPNGLFGLTDSGFIASAYFYFSCELTKRVALVLEYEDDAKEIAADMEKIKAAFWAYFLDEKGNLTIPETQTAYAMLLSFGLCPKEYETKVIDGLKRLVEKNKGHLSTGFLGTPLLCPTLSKYGEHELACELLLNEEYPGWLYEVNLGAVTIWERWNSINPDGTLSSTGMNSLNHYAYGSIVSWIYRYICGFQPYLDEENTIVIQPGYCKNLGYVSSEYFAPWGKYEVEWNSNAVGEMSVEVSVPFNGKAILKFNGKKEILGAGRYKR